MLDVSRIETPSGVVILSLHGSLDADTVHDLEDVLRETSEEGKDSLLFDLSGLEYISSAGVGTFIGCIGTMTEKNKDMIFLNPSPNIMELFEMLGFTKLFKVMADREEAIEALAAMRA